MKGAIVYSLFGNEEEKKENCFNFNSYLRGMMINIRLNKLLFPEWTTLIELDKNVYQKYFNLFNALKNGGWIDFRINESEPLTKAMLWRLKPCFEGTWDYVLCRDLDSPATYREAQAVKYWMNRDKSAHAITDSVSHDVAMLGGMIGFIPKYFTDKIGQNDWSSMFNGVNIDFNRKGADQDFLTQYIYPKFAQHGVDSITQHYFKGMPNSYLSDYNTCLCEPTRGHENYCPHNIDIGLSIELKESNGLAGHIGAAGFYTTSTYKFLTKYRDKFAGLYEIEKDYPIEFHWINDKSF
jgi:hypothetical protein